MRRRLSRILLLRRNVIRMTDPMPRSADTISSAVSNRVCPGASPALARIGCWEPLEMNGDASSLAAQAKERTLAGLKSN